jgi:hypothetical protein
LKLTTSITGESEQAYQQYQDPNQQFHNESHFSHEALAGAASFGAFKMFEDRQRAEGSLQPRKT